MNYLLRLIILGVLILPGTASGGQPSRSAKRGSQKEPPAPMGVKKEPIKTGETAPMFALKEFGRDFVFLKQYCGDGKKNVLVKAVLLDFFATDCLACVDKLDELHVLAGRYAPGLKIFLVSIDPKPEETLPAFLKEKNVSLPVLTDMYRKTLSRYGFSTVPQTVLIDGECKAVYVVRQEDKEFSALTDRLRELLD